MGVFRHRKTLMLFLSMFLLFSYGRFIPYSNASGQVDADIPQPKVKLAGDTVAGDVNTACEGVVECVWDDVRYIVNSPGRLDRNGLMVLGGISLVTGGLFVADDEIQDFFGKRHTDSRDDIADFFDTLGSFEVIFAANVALAGGGWVFRDSLEGDRLFKTALASTEAQLFTEGICSLLKFAIGRERPEEGHGHTSFSPFTHWNSSMPSSHAGRAFAMAAVFSETYEQPLPLIAYTAATLISISRVYQDKHFSSDVFIGAAIGYAVGKMLIRKHLRSNKRWTIIPASIGSLGTPGILVRRSF